MHIIFISNVRFKGTHDLLFMTWSLSYQTTSYILKEIGSQGDTWVVGTRDTIEKAIGNPGNQAGNHEKLKN